MSYDGQDDFISLSIEPRHKRERLMLESLHNSSPSRLTFRGLASTLLIMCGAGGILFSLLFLPFSLFFGYRVYAALHSWPHVDAEVNACEVYPKIISVSLLHAASQPSTVYGFRCHVTYSAASASGDPQIYRSVADLGYQISNRGDMARWSERFYPGVHTTIAYSPGNPTHVGFAGDFTAAYAAPLRALRFAVEILAVCLFFFFLGNKLRIAQKAEAST